MHRIVLIVLLPMAAGAHDQSMGCGMQAPNHQPQFRTFSPLHVIRGTEASRHSWPWHAFLEITFPDASSMCGGSLIRVSDKKEESDMLITAAHCLETEVEDDTGAHTKVKARRVSSLLGAHNRKAEESGTEVVAASAIRVHPKYDNVTNDIAVVKLFRPVQFTDAIRPVCLPAQGEALPVGKQCVTCGWGRTSNTDPEAVSDVLQQLVVPVHNASTCMRNKHGGWENAEFYDEEAMFCAGSLEGKSGDCEGDSGGGLVCKQADGAYAMYGIVSFGYGEEHPSGPDVPLCLTPGYPGVYTRVSNYVTWIEEQIQELSSVK